MVIQRITFKEKPPPDPRYSSLATQSWRLLMESLKNDLRDTRQGLASRMPKSGYERSAGLALTVAISGSHEKLLVCMSCST